MSSNSASPLSLANSHHRHWRVAACAECCLSPEYLSDPSVDWVWPGDKAVLGRLQRLGLSSFTAVATVPEKSLYLHFGKIAPILHRLGGAVYGSRVVKVSGRAEKRGEGVSLLAEGIMSVT